MPDDALSAWLREGAAPEEANETPSTWGGTFLDGEPTGTGNASVERPQRRAWRLLTLAVAPWLVVAGLVTSGWRPSRHGTTPPSTEATIHPQSSAAHQPDKAERLTMRTGSDSGTLDPALGATAAAAVQQALTGTDEASGRSRYLNLVLPEAATWIGDIAIVDVAAVVLEGAGGHWDQPRTARYAIPLRVRAGDVQVLSGPWALPDPPQTAPEGTAFIPVDDRALTEAARRALRSAGYRDVQVRELARDERLPGVLEVRATVISPGDDHPRSQKIWVSDHPSPTVLGAAHAGAREEPGDHAERPPDAGAQPPATVQGGAR